MSNLVPVSVQDALAVAKELASSGMVPRDYAGKPGAIYAAIDLGASVGLRPMQSVQGIANINGRPALWGDAALGVVMAHPAFRSIDEDDASKALAQGYGRCAVVRDGSPSYEVRFTVDMAKAASLWGKAGPWTQYPGRMLQMRARSWAFRDRFPDALKGIAIAEEARDIPPPVAVEVDGYTDDLMPRPKATPAPSPAPAADDIPFTPVAAYVPPPREEARKVPDSAESVEVTIGDVVVTKGEKDGRPWTKYAISLEGPKGTFEAVSFSPRTIGPEMQSAKGMRGIAKLSRDSLGRLTLLDMAPCE